MFFSKKTISIQQTAFSAEIWLHIDINGTILEHSANLTKSVFFKLTGLATANFQNKNIFAFIDHNSKEQLSLSLKKSLASHRK